MMNFEPKFTDFEAKYKKNEPQVVWGRVVADLETPITASLKLRQKGDPFFLLESVEGGNAKGRYSIIGIEPD